MESTEWFQEIDDEVNATEHIAVYLLSKSDYSHGVVKGRALEPSRRYGTKSSFRIDELSEQQIWFIGRTEVAEKRERTLYGRAELIVDDIRSVGLDLNSNQPPPRHAEISGWPLEPDWDRSKDARIEMAEDLAELADLKINPSR